MKNPLPFVVSFVSARSLSTFLFQVIKRANGVQYGLAAVVWSQNLSRTHRVSQRLQVQPGAD